MSTRSPFSRSNAITSGGFNPNSEVRNPNAGRIAETHRCQQEGRSHFGFRYSSFFRISGIRSSEFRFNRAGFNWALLVSLVALVATFSCLTLTASAAEPRAKPNILFIMADDHAAHALGAYGGRLAALNPTPQLDRLAREGVRLQNVFCVNSICTPSRATILTGQYPHRHGARTLDGVSLAAEQQHLPRLLREAGYETAVIGKWHLYAEPAAFDYYNVLPGQGNYFNPLFHDQRAGRWPTNLVRHPLDGSAHSYASVHVDDVVTTLSIDWLKNRPDKRRPFFLMHHFKGRMMILRMPSAMIFSTMTSPWRSRRACGSAAGMARRTRRSLAPRFPPATSAGTWGSTCSLTRCFQPANTPGRPISVI